MVCFLLFVVLSSHTTNKTVDQQRTGDNLRVQDEYVSSLCQGYFDLYPIFNLQFGAENIKGCL